jgi:hypothetical protein
MGGLRATIEKLGVAARPPHRLKVAFEPPGATLEVADTKSNIYVFHKTFFICINGLICTLFLQQYHNK